MTISSMIYSYHRGPSVGNYCRVAGRVRDRVRDKGGILELLQI